MKNTNHREAITITVTEAEALRLAPLVACSKCGAMATAPCLHSDETHMERAHHHARLRDAVAFVVKKHLGSKK